jgi:hypothetical protein
MDTRSNTGHAMSCAPAGSNGYSRPAKSRAVEAKEKARAEFVRPDSDALDRMRRENPIIELFKAARSEEGEEE